MKGITKPGDGSIYERALTRQETDIMEQADGQIMLFHMSGPMSFSSAKAMVRRHAGIANYKIMLLDLSDVPTIDFTTSRALEDIVIDTNSAGRTIFLVGACKSVCDMLEQQGVLNHFDVNNLYQVRLDALLHAQSILNNK
jgi:SulP family sulfate permease